MEGEITKLETRKLKAEEVAKEIRNSVYEVLKKARFVSVEYDIEEDKIKIWKGKEVLLEIENKDILESAVIESVIEAVEKVLKEKFKLKETDYEVEILEPSIEKYGQYGEWVWDYVDFKFGYGIEFDKEYSINLNDREEYINIYYCDITKRWHIEIGRILTEMYRKSSESNVVLLTESQIKELGLNPSDFEPYFED